MINVILPAGHLRERAYTVHVLLYEYLGLRYHLSIDADARAYEFRYGSGVIRINDAFFGSVKPPLGYLDNAYLPAGRVVQSRNDMLDHCMVLYGKDEFVADGPEMYCGVDMIASAFFMLTRWEEYVSREKDSHDRFPGSASVAAKNDFLKRPVVCEYVQLLRRWLIQSGVPESDFKRHEFSIALSIDVDYPWFWERGAGALRKIAGAAIREKSISSVYGMVRGAIASYMGTKDPWDTYDELMDLAEQKHSKATFYFMTGKNHPVDPGFTLSDPRLRSILERIRNRGHAAGIHTSYLTSEDAGNFRKEVDLFRSILADGQLEVRQHYLRIIPPFTLRIAEYLGVGMDSTLGYADLPGFRCGTCWPFPVFDFLSGRMLRLYERPLLLMDVTFRHYLEMPVEEAIATASGIKAQAVKHGGEFVVLWHNSSFNTAIWNGYEQLLETAFT